MGHGNKCGRICLASINAYHRIHPESFFKRELKASELEHARKTLVFVGFCEMFPFLGKEEDYYTALKMVDSDVDGFYEMIHKGEMENIKSELAGIKKKIDRKQLGEFKKYYKEEMKKIRKL